MKYFVVADIRNTTLPDDSGGHGTQAVWNYRARQWQPRDESKLAGRVYRTRRAAERAARRVGGYVSVDSQWALHDKSVEAPIAAKLGARSSDFGGEFLKTRSGKETCCASY